MWSYARHHLGIYSNLEKGKIIILFCTNLPGSEQLQKPAARELPALQAVFGQQVFIKFCYTSSNGLAIIKLKTNRKFDEIYCFKARVLRERGEFQEAQEIIDFVNQYRKPELYPNLVDWFQNTLDLNIKNAIEQFHSKAHEISWREVKLETAVKYREAGQCPVSDDEFERIIKEQVEILSKVK